MQRLISICLSLIALALTSGCATHALWKESDLDTWNQPASQPHPQFFHDESKNDFLVVYDELSERREKVRARAYFVKLNETRIKERQRPRFVSISSAKKFSPIPLGQTTHPDTRKYYAVIAPDGDSFKIYLGNQTIGSGEFPIYNDGSGHAKRVALTPIAVVADLTIVGGFLFLWVWSTGGLSDLH